MLKLSFSRQTSRIFGAMTLGLAALAGCTPAADDGRLDSRTLARANSFIDDTVRTEMILSPEAATRLGLEAYAGPDATSRLNDHSQAGFERARLLRVDLLAKLQRRPQLPESHLLARDLDLTTEALSRLVELQTFGQGQLSWTQTRPYAIDPFSGAWIEGPDLLINRHRINALADAEAYVTRLSSLPGAIDDTRRRLLADAGSGLVPPAALLQMTQTRIDALLAPDSETLSLLVTTLQNYVVSVQDIEAQDRERLNRIATDTVEIELRRAYTDLSTALAEFAVTAPTHGGIWAQPNGFATYLGFLAWQIGEPVDPPEQLHAINLALVETERGAFQSLLQDLGFEGELSAQLSAFETAWTAGQDAALQDAVAPPHQWPADVSPPFALTQQAALAEHAAHLTGATFITAAQDNSRPNLLLVNEAQTAIWPIWISQALTSAAYYRPHVELAEATLTAANRSVTRRLTTVQAFETGWVAYRLRHLIAEEAPPPEQAIAARQLFLFEAALAAIDTGLHIERWSLSESQAYLSRQTALPQALIEQAVIYVAAHPGEATSRMMGYRRLENLRIRSEAVLGSRFDSAAFDQVVLSDGSRPFRQVEQDVERWYEAQLP
ncbi:MAG: DUF885 family protein [Henriciella sp.]|nr:DUF885 family protein [Henriciella sp.]